MRRPPKADPDNTDGITIRLPDMSFTNSAMPKISEICFPVVQFSIQTLLSKENRFTPSVEDRGAIIGASNTQLPREIWLIIISWLDMKSVIKLSETCKTFYSIVFSIPDMENKYETEKFHLKCVKKEENFSDSTTKNKLRGFLSSLPRELFTQRNEAQKKPHQPGSNGFRMR